MGPYKALFLFRFRASRRRWFQASDACEVWCYETKGGSQEGTGGAAAAAAAALAFKRL